MAGYAKQGNLDVRGKGGLLGGKWRRAFLTIDRATHVMSQYKKAGEAKAQTAINLTMITEIAKFVEKDRLFCFELKTADPSVSYAFSASSEEEQDSWIKAVQTSAYPQPAAADDDARHHHHHHHHHSDASSGALSGGSSGVGVGGGGGGGSGGGGGGGGGGSGTLGSGDGMSSTSSTSSASSAAGGSFEMQFDSLSFEKDGLLGAGAAGSVYKAKFGRTIVAVKMMKSHDETHENEVQTLCSLHHPNILQLLGYCQRPPDTFCIVTEYLPYGNLHDWIYGKDGKTLTTETIDCFAGDISKGMDYLHEQKQIIHRDLKPENVLVSHLSPLTAKLADFGISRKQASKNQTQVCGTYFYMAPEIWTSDQYTTKADVFSFGVILWEMFHKQQPFDGDFAHQIETKIITGQRPPIDAAVPPVYAKLIEACWGVDPTRRPTFGDILELISWDDSRKSNLVVTGVGASGAAGGSHAGGATVYNVATQQSPQQQAAAAQVDETADRMRRMNMHGVKIVKGHPTLDTDLAVPTYIDMFKVFRSKPECPVLTLIETLSEAWTLDDSTAEVLRPYFDPRNTGQAERAVVEKFFKYFYPLNADADNVATPYENPAASKEPSSTNYVSFDGPGMASAQPGHTMHSIIATLSAPWFDGNLAAKSAEIKLSKPNIKPGTFIIRFSSEVPKFALTMKDTKLVRHWKMNRAGDGGFWLADLYYPTLEAFVHFHQSEPLQLNNAAEASSCLTDPLKSVL